MPSPDPTNHMTRTRAVRVAVLAPVVAGGLFATAGMAHAQDDTTPSTEVTTPSTEATTSTTAAPTTTTTEAPAPSNAPTISSVLPRPGALTVAFAPAEGFVPLANVVVAKVGDQVKSVQTVLGDVHSASLTGLTNGTEYDVTVTSIGTLLFSTTSSITKATPKADGSAVIAPLAVQDLQVNRSKSSATVTWGAPTTDGGSAIVAYVVNAVNQSTGKVAIWRTLPGDVRSASLAPLANGIAYDVNVFAISTAGLGVVDSVDDVLGSTAFENPLAPALPWAAAYVTDTGKVVASWGAAVEQGVATSGFNALIIQGQKIVGWNVTKADGRSVEVSGLDKTKDADVYVFSSSPVGFGEAKKITIKAPVAPPAEVPTTG
jgi:hypothetical protein